MRYASRSTILGALVAVIVLAGGCLGVITGSEPAVFTATGAGVDEAALSETGFEHEGTETVWTNRTVEVAGQSRDVRVQSHVTVYRLPVSVEPDAGVTFGLFTVVSTPQASIAGQAMNPIGRISHRELLEQFATGSGSGSGGLEDIQRDGSRTLTVLGSDAEVVRFAAVASRSGQEVPVYVELTRVRHDGDFVVALGVYPQESDDVRSQVSTLFGGVEH